MSKFNCPANNEILCDQHYELDEYYRQLCMTLDSGEYGVVISSNANCQVDSRQCPRYQNSLYQRYLRLIENANNKRHDNQYK